MLILARLLLQPRLLPKDGRRLPASRLPETHSCQQCLHPPLLFRAGPHRELPAESIGHVQVRGPNVFPGYQYETIYGDKGWGGACFRDDLRIAGGQRTSNYSRLEMTVRPYSPSLHVLELAAKGTIRNKEAFNRNYYEKLEEVDE